MCVRAWERGKLLTVLLYAHVFLSQPISEAISWGSGGKRKLHDGILVGEWIGILGLVGAEVLGWNWDCGLLARLGYLEEMVEQDTNEDAEKGKNRNESRSEQANGEVI